MILHFLASAVTSLPKHYAMSCEHTLIQSHTYIAFMLDKKKKTLTPTNIWLLSSVVFKGTIDIHSPVESASALSGSDGNMTHCFFSQFFSSMM